MSSDDILADCRDLCLVILSAAQDLNLRLTKGQRSRRSPGHPSPSDASLMVSMTVPLSFPRLRGNKKGASPLAGEEKGASPLAGKEKGASSLAGKEKGASSLAGEGEGGALLSMTAWADFHFELEHSR